MARPALWLGMTGGIKPRSLKNQRKRKPRFPMPYKTTVRAVLAAQRARGGVGRAKPVKDTPRKLRPRSKSMAAKMKLYREKREAFLKARPLCFACKVLAGTISRAHLGELGLALFEVDNAIRFREEARQRGSHSATTLHHMRGRAGKLLLDERHWKGCCLPAHQFIDANPTLARLAGLLCEPGQWNKYEP